MILWWIGDILLLRRRTPCRACTCSELSSTPRGASCRACRRSPRWRPPGRRTSTLRALLLTTQDQVAQTVAGVANYGASLDVILDDAQQED